MARVPGYTSFRDSLLAICAIRRHVSLIHVDFIIASGFLFCDITSAMTLHIFIMLRRETRVFFSGATSFIERQLNLDFKSKRYSISVLGFVADKLSNGPTSHASPNARAPVEFRHSIIYTKVACERLTNFLQYF